MGVRSEGTRQSLMRGGRERNKMLGEGTPKSSYHIMKPSTRGPGAESAAIEYETWSSAIGSLSSWSSEKHCGPFCKARYILRFLDLTPSRISCHCS